MKSLLAAFLLLSSLGGCASDVPLVIREPPADNPTLADVQSNPTAFVNRRVTWGGIIVSTRSIEKRTEVEIRAKALRTDGRPELGDVSLGRFLASNDGFLDPAVYSAGREVTVYGVLQNVLVRNIGTHPYLYPTVKAAQLYLWTEQSEYGYDDWYPPFHFGLGFGVGL
ncbi:MAG: Slp family lipoprotein [Acidobacteria bacterium]|nr:Slp family lipoprotein [Acidobacteriota bacterium]